MEPRKLDKSQIWGYLQDEVNRIPDGRALVLILHLQCEFFIEGLIKHKLKHPSKMNWDNWNFARKRELAYTMDLIDKTMNDDMKKLSTIRNQYSHHINPDPSKVAKALRELSNYPHPDTAKRLNEYGNLKYAILKNLNKLLDLWWKEFNKTDASEFKE